MPLKDSRKTSHYPKFFPNLLGINSKKVFRSTVNGTVEVYPNFGLPYVLVNNFPQSGPFVERIWNSYLDFFRKSLSSPKSIKRVLVIGLAGNAILKSISNKLGRKIQIDVVEIDPVMVTVAKRYFRVRQSSQLRLIIDDIHHFLRNPVPTYDVIFYDAYVGCKLPRMFQKPFLSWLNKALLEDGYLLINIPDKNQSSANLDFLTALIAPNQRFIYSYSATNHLLILPKTDG